MAKTVQARLDHEALALLGRLRRQTGLTDSELLRRGLGLLENEAQTRPRRRIAGLGRFASGHPDLGSNARHLAGFGRW